MTLLTTSIAADAKSNNDFAVNLGEGSKRIVSSVASSVLPSANAWINISLIGGITYFSTDRRVNFGSVKFDDIFV